MDRALKDRCSQLVAVSFCLSLVLVVSCGTSPPAVRPSKWAKPLAREGLENLHQIDEGLYRSAQPEAGGIPELEKLGVRTILNLRSAHDDSAILAGSGITEIRQLLHASELTQEQLVTALKTMIDPKRRPVLVHCHHGADRTGAVCAAYRVVVQRWSKADAIEELRRGGYHFHSIFRSIPRLIQNMDVAAMRRQIGIPSHPSTAPGSSSATLPNGNE